MKLDLTGLIYALSYALDAVEAQMVGIAKGHAKRVAYLVMKMGKRAGFTPQRLQTVSILAAMHDNALTQYIQAENSNEQMTNLGIHCSLGEANILKLPLQSPIQNAVLNHHERCDGKGPFHKMSEEISLEARLIHLADTIDPWLTHHQPISQAYEELKCYLKQEENKSFSKEEIDLFLLAFPLVQLQKLEGADMRAKLYEESSPIIRDFSLQEIKCVMDLFAQIVDYKSEFTSNHSKGISALAYQMGRYYGFDEEMCIKLLMAGALHDIGKMVIINDILEKPGKLLEEEYVTMKNHAYYTRVILSDIAGLEDVCEWASNHHEKLNGNGYPKGLKADQLDFNSRLLAVLDVYQALVEPRPYKEGFSKEKTFFILNNMVLNEELDGKIVLDLQAMLDTF